VGPHIIRSFVVTDREAPGLYLASITGVVSPTPPTTFMMKSRFDNRAAAAGDLDEPLGVEKCHRAVRGGDRDRVSRSEVGDGWEWVAWCQAAVVDLFPESGRDGLVRAAGGGRGAATT
jgi:hypothetical protein